ncbi:MAG: neutral zinc metallopeptidase [Propionibacteriaceae bacterium]|jgi:predicted metalloprotease|nr:neutral zinc metallopeptidase [Propionibacteriaceae bacterium]
MTFSTGGNFEGGRVRTGKGKAVAAGGGVGLVGLLVVAAAYIFGGNQVGSVVSGIVQQAGSGTQVISGGDDESGYVGDCSAEQANSDRNCRLSATVQALDAYWAVQLPKQGNVDYTQPTVVSFSGETSTACGQANSSTGPFYCPGDETIYVDVSFYDLLQSEYGSSGGPLAEEYVIAHELGHHIQDELGLLTQASSQEGASGGSVRTELMADCLAGMWAGSAATTVDPDTGKTFLEPITDAQLKDALSAAASVGDDHIQQTSGGYVDPESFTHGTSDQRQYWFSVGYQKGTLKACDTFNATSLDRP